MVLSVRTAADSPRLSWETIDYSPPLPDSFLVPEHHWPRFQHNSLSALQRVRLNHFATYFMCEMFIHFERSIIEYIEMHRGRLQPLSSAQIQRFIEEELAHVRAFETLALKIRPDLYRDGPRFLKRAAADSFIVKRTPVSTFFLMAALFEEMTLFVHTVMTENPGQSWKPCLDVMHLHALEERGHIGMDRLIIEGRRAGAVQKHLESMILLPLVLYSDMRVARAWKKAAAFFSKEEGLTQAQSRQIAQKGMSRSDMLGMASYVQKNKDRPLPGNGLLCFALAQKIQ